jgi:hypothetical protein
MCLIMILDEIATQIRDNKMNIWSSILRPFGDTNNRILNITANKKRNENKMNRNSTFFNKQTTPLIEY